MCRIPCRYTVWREIPRDNAPCPDDTAVANCYPRAYDNIRPKPAGISDPDRLCIAQPSADSVTASQRRSLFCHKRVTGRDDGYIRANITAVPNGYFGIILHREIKVDKALIPDSGVTAIVKSNRSLQKRTVAELCQQLTQDLITAFQRIFSQSIVLFAQCMSFLLHSNQLLVVRRKQLSFQNLIFFLQAN